MNLPKFLTSPLAATAGVLAGLALLAVPLHRLTSAPPVAVMSVPSTTTPATVPAWLSLKLLAPAESVTLKTTDGTVLWQLAETPAGDVETQAELPLDHGGIDLIITVVFHGGDAETAVFLTLAPDGLEEQTRHAIGSGTIDEPLTFTWPSR